MTSEAHPATSAMATPRYRPDIDGLRALAIVPVVAFHAFPTWVPGGFVGVDVFFVISGYLISSIILTSLAAGTFSFSGFYARRIRRIFPALVVVLIACGVWGWFALFASDYARLGKHIAGGAGFVSNFVFWNEAGYFDAASDTKPLLHLWSLGIEEQFYLLWPLLLFIGWRRAAALPYAIALILAASLLTNVIQVRSDQVAAFYSPWTRLWELMLGSALAYLALIGLPELLRGVSTRALSVWNGLRGVAAVLGLSLVAFAIVAFNAGTSFPGWRAGIPTAGTALLIASGPDAWLNRQVLAKRALVWIGLISYPLYLWHWPLLAFTRLAYLDTPSAGIRLVAIAVSVGLASVTYLAVERPIRFGWRGRTPVILLVVTMAIAGVAGYVTYAADGFFERAINRSDQAHFLAYYERLHKKGLRSAYRAECDFMDWETETTRAAIDPACTAAGSRGTMFLWGDSHAQALSLGIRTILPEGVRLAQVTTSGCAPRLVDVDPQALHGRCVRANEYARAQIAAVKPEVVILAQILGHDATDWAVLADGVRQLGARRVVLVGPAPQWHPSLPAVVANQYWGHSYERVGYGLNADMLTLDRAMSDRLAHDRHLRYVSLVQSLCTNGGCLATVPGTDGQLMAVDSGHLSPQGSIYVAETILRPALLQDE